MNTANGCYHMLLHINGCYRTSTTQRLKSFIKKRQALEWREVYACMVKGESGDYGSQIQACETMKEAFWIIDHVRQLPMRKETPFERWKLNISWKIKRSHLETLHPEWVHLNFDPREDLWSAKMIFGKSDIIMFTKRLLFLFICFIISFNDFQIYKGYKI